MSASTPTRPLPSLSSSPINNRTTTTSAWMFGPPTVIGGPVDFSTAGDSQPSSSSSMFSPQPQPPSARSSAQQQQHEEEDRIERLIQQRCSKPLWQPVIEHGDTDEVTVPNQHHHQRNENPDDLLEEEETFSSSSPFFASPFKPSATAANTGTGGGQKQKHVAESAYPLIGAAFSSASNATAPEVEGAGFGAAHSTTATEAGGVGAGEDDDEIEGTIPKHNPFSSTAPRRVAAMMVRNSSSSTETTEQQHSDSAIPFGGAHGASSRSAKVNHSTMFGYGADPECLENELQSETNAAATLMPSLDGTLQKQHKDPVQVPHHYYDAVSTRSSLNANAPTFVPPSWTKKKKEQQPATEKGEEAPVSSFLFHPQQLNQQGISWEVTNRHRVVFPPAVTEKKKKHPSALLQPSVPQKKSVVTTSSAPPPPPDYVQHQQRNQQQHW